MPVDTLLIEVFALMEIATNAAVAAALSSVRMMAYSVIAEPVSSRSKPMKRSTFFLLVHDLPRHHEHHVGLSFLVAHVLEQFSENRDVRKERHFNDVFLLDPAQQTAHQDALTGLGHQIRREFALFERRDEETADLHRVLEVQVGDVRRDLRADRTA